MSGWTRCCPRRLDGVLQRATSKINIVLKLPREAIVEKKIAARQVKRAREESPDAPPGRMDLMGDGDDSFTAAKARCVVFLNE